MILTESAFVAHLAACILVHPVAAAAPTELATAVAYRESGLNTLAIGINAEPRRRLPAESHKPATVAEAKEIVAAALKAGRRVDVGVMQITNANWSAFGLTIDTIFDPAANICAGARILGQGYALELRRARRAALCRYNTGGPDCSNGYPEGVLEVAARPRQAPAATAPVEVAEAPAEPPTPRIFDIFERARLRFARAETPSAPATEAAGPEAAPRLVSTERAQ